MSRNDRKVDKLYQYIVLFQIMNKEAYTIFNKILTKQVNELSSYEKSFLRARRDYLISDLLEKYTIILDEVVVPIIAIPGTVTTIGEPVVADYSSMTYAQVLSLAKKHGFKGARKPKEYLIEYIKKTI